MTTTPGPRTEASVVITPTVAQYSVNVRENIRKLRAELPETVAAIEAEARADVDGLVALTVDWNNIDANGNVRLVKDIWVRDGEEEVKVLALVVDWTTQRALLAGDKAKAPDEQWQGPEISLSVMAGDKAENWDDFEPLELLAGDKAEAPTPTARDVT